MLKPRLVRPKPGPSRLGCLSVLLLIVVAVVVLSGCAAWHELSDDQRFAVVATIPLGVVIAAGKHQQED